MSGENTWDFYVCGASDWLKANPLRTDRVLTISHLSDLKMLKMFQSNGLILTRQGHEYLETLEARGMLA